MSIVTFLKDLNKDQINGIIKGGNQYENISYDAVYKNCFVKIMNTDTITLERPFSSTVDSYIEQCNLIIKKYSIKNYSGDVEQWLSGCCNK